MSDEQQPGDKVLHQDAIEEVIGDEFERASDHGVIADLPAASVAYVQAEATATRTTLNAVLDVLRDANLIPSA